VVSLEAGRSLVQGDPSNGKKKKKISKTQKSGVRGFWGVLIWNAIQKGS
jgi:hypothetical protein